MRKTTIALIVSVMLIGLTGITLVTYLNGQVKLFQASAAMLLSLYGELILLGALLLMRSIVRRLRTSLPRYSSIH
jgi:hypothetical protein